MAKDEHVHDWHYDQTKTRFDENDCLRFEVTRFCSSCLKVETIKLNDHE